MFGSQVLEVAIGLAFVYFFLSLICSTINEWIARLWELRSRTLEQAISNLLNDPDLKNQIYAQPLIKGLARSGAKPSYIPSHTFALALLNIIAPDPLASSPQAFQQKVAALPDSEIKGALLSLVSAQQDLRNMRQSIETWFDNAMDRVPAGTNGERN